MEDRTPTPGQEGRVLITPENGSPYYAKIEMADNPTQQGTPLTKETLLQDSTEIEIFGNSSNRTVDDAFVGIMGKISLIMENAATMTLTVENQSGVPMPNVHVDGIFDENGDSLSTNESGQISGYVSEGNTIFSVSGYADIVDFSEQFEVVKGQSYSHTIQLTTRNFIKITSSKNIKFSGNVEQVDVTCVGGGGGAIATAANHSANGGAGGYCVVQEDVNFSSNVLYSAIIGSGGTGASFRHSASDGGKTSFLGVSANGGAGGQYDVEAPAIGNGNGAYATKAGFSGYTLHQAGEGTVQGFSSFSDTVLYGGGGLGGWVAEGDGYDVLVEASGAGYGAKVEAGNGTNGFGGGGGASTADMGDSRGGNGGSGCIAIRMHLKSAA